MLMLFCYAHVNEKHPFLSWQTCIYVNQSFFEVSRLISWKYDQNRSELLLQSAWSGNAKTRKQAINHRWFLLIIYINWRLQVCPNQSFRYHSSFVHFCVTMCPYISAYSTKSFEVHLHCATCKVHFEWPPLPPLESPWDGPLGKVLHYNAQTEPGP